MSERRIDPFTGRSVLVAPSRRGIGGARPAGLPQPSGRCPFCPGHEADTEETLARWPDAGAWKVRVVHNKFPLVSAQDGLGAHEVVIETPTHDADLADLAVDHLEGWLRVLRDRATALARREGIEAVTIYRNRGLRAGSSQPHPHTQILAARWVSATLADRWARLREEPIYEAELARELAGPRLIAADDHLLACCPFASTRAYESRFMPRAPRGGFDCATDAELASLSRMLHRVLLALRDEVGVYDHNLIVRQPPVRATGPRLAWYVELLPRTGGDAGFELATEDRVLVVDPEDAANVLRG
ncbi:MAG: DUF4931 domain-containing protein [Sandaracinaceae bacterium]